MVATATSVIKPMAQYHHSGYRDQCSHALAQLHQVSKRSTNGIAVTRALGGGHGTHHVGQVYRSRSVYAASPTMRVRRLISR